VPRDAPTSRSRTPRTSGLRVVRRNSVSADSRRRTATQTHAGWLGSRRDALVGRAAQTSGTAARGATKNLISDLPDGAERAGLRPFSRSRFAPARTNSGFFCEPSSHHRDGSRACSQKPIMIAAKSTADCRGAIRWFQLPSARSAIKLLGASRASVFASTVAPTSPRRPPRHLPRS
jgi:hypothetical protein